jgi:hypothetical protein
MALGLQPGDESRNGLLFVELQDLFGGEPGGQVIPLEVVAEADAQ